MNPAQTKWDRIYSEKKAVIPQAADVLSQNQHLLPPSGIALDLACGLGGNSLFLAECGLHVKSWDISKVAIEQLKQQSQGLMIESEVKDISATSLEENSFDVIVVSHFLVREMAEAIQAALKPGGVLFYQTFCRHKVEQVGPSNPDYLLEDNELLTMFPSLIVRVYREEASLGRPYTGWRNQAMLVAQKPQG